MKSIVYPCDVRLADREIWVVKVPDVIAEVVKSSSAPTAEIGTFRQIEAAPTSRPRPSAYGAAAARTAGGATHKLGSGAEPPAKRARISLGFTMNKDRATEVLGEAALAYTPLEYTLNLDRPNGLRALSFTDRVGFSITGCASQLGQLLPVRGDAFTAQARLRFEQERDAAASRKKLRVTEEVVGPLARAQKWSAATSAAETAPATIIHGITMGTARSVHECFDKAAYWSIKDLAGAMGLREVDLKTEVQTKADYIKKGPHRGKWRLKSEYRSITSATPDDLDGIPAE